MKKTFESIINCILEQENRRGQAAKARLRWYHARRTYVVTYPDVSGLPVSEDRGRMEACVPIPQTVENLTVAKWYRLMVAHQGPGTVTDGVLGCVYAALEEEQPEEPTVAEWHGFRKGQRVEHKEFGSGEVWGGYGDKIRVRFDKEHSGQRVWEMWYMTLTAEQPTTPRIESTPTPEFREGDWVVWETRGIGRGDWRCGQVTTVLTEGLAVGYARLEINDNLYAYDPTNREHAEARWPDAVVHKTFALRCCACANKRPSTHYWPSDGSFVYCPDCWDKEEEE